MSPLAESLDSRVRGNDGVGNGALKAIQVFCEVMRRLCSSPILFQSRQICYHLEMTAIARDKEFQ
jgi:hypothetical protein